jgi:hypothetical protein
MYHVFLLFRGTSCFKFDGQARAKETFDRKLPWNGMCYGAVYGVVIRRTFNT